MGVAVVGIIGALLGVLVGGLIQQLQATRGRAWQRADSLADAKRLVYAEYLRAISASYAQAQSGQRNPSENAALLAAKSEIEILAGDDVARSVRLLTEKVMTTHESVAERVEDVASEIKKIDGERLDLIDLFKADLDIRSRR